MGILDGNPGDFQDWIINNSDNLQKHSFCFGESSSGPNGYRHECNHYPRAIMGEYLKTRFQGAAQLAQDMDLAIRLYPTSEVVDLRLNGGKICLIIKDLLFENDFSSDADRVLLATGHWVGKNDQDGYFTSPWPAEKLLRKIPKGARIADDLVDYLTG